MGIFYEEIGHRNVICGMYRDNMALALHKRLKITLLFGMVSGMGPRNRVRWACKLAPPG